MYKLNTISFESAKPNSKGQYRLNHNLKIKIGVITGQEEGVTVLRVTDAKGNTEEVFASDCSFFN